MIGSLHLTLALNSIVLVATTVSLLSNGSTITLFCRINTKVISEIFFRSNGIPVDFQVSRVMIQTNAVVLKEPCSTQDVSVRIILPVLTEIFESEKINPRLVSEAIWFIGSRCCNKSRHDLCPISDLCTSLISRESYDRSGKFDPADVGRYDPPKSKKKRLNI